MEGSLPAAKNELDKLVNLKQYWETSVYSQKSVPIKPKTGQILLPVRPKPAGLAGAAPKVMHACYWMLCHAELDEVLGMQRHEVFAMVVGGMVRRGSPTPRLQTMQKYWRIQFWDF